MAVLVHTIVAQISNLESDLLGCPHHGGNLGFECGGGWTPSVVSVTTILSDSASDDSEKVLHHAPRYRPRPYCRQMQPTGPKTGVGGLVQRWTIGFSKHDTRPYFPVG